MTRSRASRRELNSDDLLKRRARHEQGRQSRRGINKEIEEILHEISQTYWYYALLPVGTQPKRNILCSMTAALATTVPR